MGRDLMDGEDRGSVEDGVDRASVLEEMGRWR